VSPATEPASLPAIVVPAFPLLGPYVVSGTNALPSGDYSYDEFTISGTLTLVGPMRLVVDDFTIRSNSSIVVDATNGAVEVYVNDDFVLNSNALVASTTFMPSDVAFNLLSDNIINPSVEVNLDVVDFNSNSMLYGTIYAPNAHVEIDSNFELFGSLVAKEVDLDSSAKVHYDESLAGGGSGRSATWETLCWRILPVD
jgi:hypothetical protein